MRILFYQSYGSDRRYHLELTYSILSAYEFLKQEPADIRLVLVADEQNVRHDLPVQHVVLDAATAREWQMHGSYNHAMHAYSTHHVLKEFKAPTILVDSDTIFSAHPKLLFDRIGPGKSLFHAREGSIDQTPEWQSWNDLITRTQGVIEGFSLSETTVMFNAGIIGLDPEDTSLMEKIKEVMFAIRAESDVFTAVQLAASMVLGTATTVSTCEDVLEHYWGGPREYYRYQINKTFPEIMSGQPLKTLPETLPKLKSDLVGAAREKLVARFRGILNRESREYRHAYMCHLSAQRASRSDPGMANVWSVEAFNVLTYGVKSTPVNAAKDFASTLPDKVADCDWMRPDVKQRWKQFWTKNSDLINAAKSGG